METNKRFIRWNPRIFIVIIIFILAFVYFISPKVTNKTLCPRTGYYNMPEEFKRSLSLIMQRMKTDENEVSPKNQEDGFKKSGKVGYCLDIQYADLSSFSAEGIFFMDENSKPDRLKIYVDQNYKQNDDLLIALLLEHEVTHALQYYDDLLGENNFPFPNKQNTPENNCYDKEIEAFLMQYVLFTSFKDEEIKSLIYRLQQSPYSNDSYANLIKIVQFTEDAYLKCGSYQSDCSVKAMLGKITDYVKSSPFYQKQCQAQQ